MPAHNEEDQQHLVDPITVPAISFLANQDRMAPSTVDLLFLTFNCAKALINTTVFANHFEAALGQNATDLPDLVVL